MSSTGDISLIKTYILMEAGDPLAVVTWCQNMGLIAKEYACPKCCKSMRLVARADIVDKYCWRCQCKGQNTKRSIRSGSWFEESKLSIPKILQITCLWIANAPMGLISHQCEVSGPTVTDWASFCREVCFEIFVSGMDKLGGPGVVVEIDESKFGKRKYNRGRRVDGQWVFGIYERGSGRCYFAAVEDRTKDTLLEIIKTRINPGTTIMSDCWKSYDCLKDHQYKHLTVNHSLNFVDPDTGAHTNAIEGTWSAIKRGFHGTNKAKSKSSYQFDSYLAEYIWRKSTVSPLEKVKSFYQMSCELYPPSIKDPARA